MSVLGLIPVAPVWSAGQSTTGLQVQHWARALQPGEVVRVTVRASEPIQQLDGIAFERPFGFYPVGDGLTWEALVGLDLEVPSGSHALEIRAMSSGAAPVTVLHDLTIVGKRFAVRRLSVPESFSTPSPAVRERIEREAERLAALFAAEDRARAWHDGFITPVPGASTSSFGRRSIVNGQPGSPHRGADFRAPFGTPVLAPNAGHVVLADELYLAGRTVVLDHGLGLFSLLAHLSAISVKEGDRVERGATIGRSGATGRVTGPHLHWGVRLTGASIDPLALMAATRRAP